MEDTSTLSLYTFIVPNLLRLPDRKASGRISILFQAGAFPIFHKGIILCPVVAHTLQAV